MRTHLTSSLPASNQPSDARPFLKWSGGKRRLLPKLLPLLPAGRRLVEPFVGAGSVFLATSYDSYLLGDANSDLINVFCCAQRDWQGLARSLHDLFVIENMNEDAFRAARKSFNESDDPLLKSALFIYLNRFGFNGLCRYNRRGELNTPYGKPERLPKVPLDALESFSLRAQRAKFRHADFLDILDSAQPGDVVYCDPPYLDLVHTKSFTSYTASGFSAHRQIELVEAATTLANKGIPVVISNHDTEEARLLYRDAELHSFNVRRSISAESSSRGAAAELVAIYR